MINKIVLRRESYMKNERNRTIDFFRAIAILSVLFYHFYYLCNYPYQSVPVIHRILSSGGEIGVTLFFIISGYGICGSLMRMEQTDGSVSWKKFMKKRFVRILPQYYGSIIVLLLITSNSSYMNKKCGGNMIDFMVLCKWRLLWHSMRLRRAKGYKIKEI